MAKGIVCAVDDCSNTAICKGFCSPHYARWYRYGDAEYVPKSETRAFIEQAICYKDEDCLFWPFPFKWPRHVYIRINEKQIPVTRYICEKVHGNPPTLKHEAAHSCGMGHLVCVNPKHLRWATRTENQADRLIHGTHNRGEKCGAAKLTEGDVREIRKMLNNGIDYKDIAESFSVNRATIHHIWRGTTWAWFS